MHPRGRGARFNPPNRFLPDYVEPDDSQAGPEQPGLLTQFLPDSPREIISHVNSPDIPFSYSVNPYQGCEHGCIYCYARNTHEFWGFSAGLDFERKIMVKHQAPALLRQALSRRSYQCLPIHFSGNTDCYQPAERRFSLTRQLLGICLEFRNPVSIITKNSLILRDLDILQKMAGLGLVQVFISVTTLSEPLRLALEPRTVTARQRFRTIAALTEAGVPVGLMTAPIIPGLNDHEIPELLRLGAAHGAATAGYTLVRLNGAIGPLFDDWIRNALPDRAEKVLGLIKSCHGGQLHDSRFGTRLRGEGPLADVIRQLHRQSRIRYFKDSRLPDLRTDLFVQQGMQLKLF